MTAVLTINPSPAVDGYIRENAKKNANLKNIFSKFYENNMEKFGIMVRQNSSAQYALWFIEIG